MKTTVIETNETNDCNRDCDEHMCDVSTGCTRITTGKNFVCLEYWLINLKFKKNILFDKLFELKACYIIYCLQGYIINVFKVILLLLSIRLYFE